MGEGKEYFKFSIRYCVKYYMRLELFLEKTASDMNVIDLFNVLLWR